jgi:hypothetical protein
MSLITLPSALKVRSCSLKLAVNQRVSAAPFGGSEQAVDLLNDRWLMTCEITPRLKANGAAIEAFIGAMRGQTNTTSVYHFARPAPLGTVRGTLTLNASAAQGASSIVVTGCSPSTGTLLAGDMLGVSGLLLMVASDCTAVAGVITVPITNALRKALTIGASVTWDKPSMTARILATSDVGYEPGIAQGVTFDFGEAI